MSYPPDFLTLQTAVISKLRLDTTNDVADVKDWINQVYTELVCECEYLQDGATMNLQLGVCSYTLPSSVFRFKSIRVKQSSGEYGPPLDEINIDDMAEKRYYGGQTTSSVGPMYFTLVGALRLELYPAPSAGDVVHMYIVKFPTPMVQTSDKPILPEPYGSKAIEYGALAEAADFLGDPSENNYRQLAMYWKRKLLQHRNRISGGSVWQLPIKGWGGYVPASNAADVRGN